MITLLALITESVETKNDHRLAMEQWESESKTCR